MQQTRRGGARPGSGRHKTGRDIPVCFKITKEAYNILAQIKNKSEYINRIILLNGVQGAVRGQSAWKSKKKENE